MEKDIKEVKDLKKELQTQKKVLSKHITELEKQKGIVSEQKKIATEQKKQVKLLKAERARIKVINDRLKKHADNYLSETKKALSTAIVAAFAFLMALTWREYITEIVESLLRYSPLSGRLVSAILVTLISVTGIIIVTRTLRVKEELPSTNYL